MKHVKQLFTEALDPINKIANSILKKLNYIESHIIIKAETPEEVKDFLIDTCGYHSNAFTELPEDKQELVAKKVWERIHKILTKETPVAETNDNLEQTIYDFLVANGGILFPLENSARNLANTIRNKK